MTQTSTIRILAVLALLAMSCLTAKAQWELTDPLPMPLGEISPVVWNGKIYVFGGKIDGLYSSNTVWVYDPDLGWASGGQIPDSLEDVTVEEYGGLFYLFGGHSHPDFIYRREVMTYDPATQAFDTVGITPRPMGFFTTAVLNDKIYLMGGDCGQVSDKVDIFDPVTFDWEVGPTMPTHRIVAYADTLDGKIYVTGGTEGTFAYASAEMYDPAGSWTTCPANMHNPRGFHACASGYGKLFVLGGTNVSAPILNQVEYFDPQLEAWTDFDPMIYFRRKFGAAILDGYLYVIGGGGSTGEYLTMVERHVVDTTSSVTDGQFTPVPVQLSQNAPNPFSAQTTISYELKNSCEVNIQVFDLNGQTVTVLFNGRQGAGEYSVTWDAAGVPAGVYFYRLMTENGVLTRKCILQ